MGVLLLYYNAHVITKILHTNVGSRMSWTHRHSISYSARIPCVLRTCGNTHPCHERSFLPHHWNGAECRGPQHHRGTGRSGWCFHHPNLILAFPFSWEELSFSCVIRVTEPCNCSSSNSNPFGYQLKWPKCNAVSQYLFQKIKRYARHASMTRTGRSVGTGLCGRGTPSKWGWHYLFITPAITNMQCFLNKRTKFLPLVV